MGLTAEKAAIVGSFAPATNAEAADAAREAAGLPEVRFVEVRLDRATEPLEYIQIRNLLEGKKAIATLRTAREGGGFSGSRDEERKILAGALEAGFDLVDVEYRDGENADLFGFDKMRVIVSCHDLASVPSLSSLSKKISVLSSSGAAHVKYVASPTDSFEAIRLLDAQAAARGGNVTIFGMGEAGIATRVLAPYLGAELAYGALVPGKATAPGQLLARDLFEIYSMRKRRTINRLYALFGGFVSHSLSPAIHNANFEAAGDEALYVPFALRSFFDEFAPLVAALERLGLPLQGASVTIPFKEDAARAGLGEDPATNTLVNAGGVFAASNTDRIAMEELIPNARGGGRGERALVIGAGGTARIAVEVLRGKGYDVAIYNRNETRAKALADETGATVLTSLTSLTPLAPPSLPPYSPSKQIPGGAFRILVNATPLGLKETDPLPCPESLLRPGLLVVDAPYRPGGTALVKAARNAGADVVDGLSLLLAQAAGQAELFTRRPTTREDLLDKLSPRLKALFTFAENTRGALPREVSS